MTDKQFKRGEQYRLADGAHDASGSQVRLATGSVVWVIMDGPNSDGDVEISSKCSGRLWYVLPEYLLLLDEPAAPTFKRGERYRLVKGARAAGGLEVQAAAGSMVTVLNGGPDCDGDVEIYDEQQRLICDVMPEYLLPVDEPAPPTFRKGEQYRLDEGARSASGRKVQAATGSVVKVIRDGPDLGGDVWVRDRHLTWYVMPKYLLPLDEPTGPSSHPDAVTFPVSPPEGMHWEKCTTQEYIDEDFNFVFIATSGNPVAHYRAVPDAPADMEGQDQ